MNVIRSQKEKISNLLDTCTSSHLKLCQLLSNVYVESKVRFQAAYDVLERISYPIINELMSNF